jgi:hypothetical protein
MFSDSFFLSCGPNQRLQCAALSYNRRMVTLCFTVRGARRRPGFERIRSRHTDAWFGYVGKVVFFASGMTMEWGMRTVQLRMGLARFVDNK